MNRRTLPHITKPVLGWFFILATVLYISGAPLYACQPLPPYIDGDNPSSAIMSENGSPTAFSLQLTAHDPENGIITWCIETRASHGTASVSGTGATKDISYTPNTNYFGTDSFVVMVTDPTLLSDTLIVNVTIQESTPVPLDRIDTRETSTGSGVYQFYDTTTDETFTPQGFTYLYPWIVFDPYPSDPLYTI